MITFYTERAVEQLLGRVLRMPYAEKRTQNDLNIAYAHVSSKSWPHAISKLREKLVSMGFEEQEAEAFIYAQPAFPLDKNKASSFTVNIRNKPNLSNFDLIERNSVNIIEHSDYFELKIENGISNNLAEKLVASVTDKKDKEEIRLKTRFYLKNQISNYSPSERGEKLIIPQLCLDFEGNTQLAEPELYLDKNGWNLLDYSTILTQNEFSINEQAKQYTVDIDGKKLVVKFLDHPEQLSFEKLKTEWTETDLCRWLDKKLRSHDIKQEILLEFLHRVIKSLLASNNSDLPQLLRSKFILEKALQEKINNYRKLAYNRCYQLCMFGEEAIAIISPQNFSFSFDPNNYPTNSLYEGNLGFNKHYYSRIAAMNKEEAECAFILDQNPNIKYWVRNLERNPNYAFWLPTSTDKFYPDFVALLNNNKILVIEYKGEHLDNPDTKEKELIGQVWAEKSSNIFLMAWKKDRKGRGLEAQIKDCLM